MARAERRATPKAEKGLSLLTRNRPPLGLMRLLKGKRGRARTTLYHGWTRSRPLPYNDGTLLFQLGDLRIAEPKLAKHLSARFS